MNYYRKKKKNNNIKKILLFLMTIVIFVILVESVDLIKNKNKIYPGVTIAGISLGGMTKEEAKLVIGPVMEKTINSNRLLLFENKEFVVNPKEHLNAYVELSELIENAYNICRQGSIIRRIQERFSSLKYGFEIPLSLYYQKEKMEQTLQKIHHEIQRNPISAILKNNRVVESVTGVKLDKDKLSEILISNLSEIDDSKYLMNIPVIIENPQVKTVDILEELGTKYKISDYTTSMEGKEDNTIFNITLAAELINGIIVKKNEIFSFNEFVGAAEKEDGFKESTIIANGKFVNGYGGGVCQVASTLYNALIMGNFEIVERYNHSVYGDATKYVPLGRDSSIFYGYKDLKFRNNYKEDIILFAKVRGNVLRVVILGKNEKKVEIEIISKDKKVIDYEIIRQKDENLAKGKELVAQEGVNGYEIKTYRIIKQDGTEKIELLSSDIYKSVPMIIKEN